jgi:hypothetical protein
MAKAIVSTNSNASVAPANPAFEHSGDLIKQNRSY